MKDKLQKFIPFAKVDEAKRQVWGIVTAEVPDKDDEVCDYKKSKPHYEALISEMSKISTVNPAGGDNFFPLRAMHTMNAIGKCIGFELRDVDKEIFMGFEVVDDNEWKKVAKNVYTGFSQGGSKVGEQVPDPVFKGCMRYVAKPSEASLVDNPCLGVAHFAYVKADGAVELRKYSHVEEPITIPASRLEGIIEDVKLLKASQPKLVKQGNIFHYMKLKLKPAGVERKKLVAIQEHMRKHARVAVNKLYRKFGDVGHTLSFLDDDLGKLAKGMGDVSRLASFVEGLSYLCYGCVAEQDWEDDSDSKLPDMLAANVNDLLDTLLAMTMEEANELREEVAGRVAKDS